MGKCLTDSEFKERVKQKYGDRFEVLSDYKGSKSKVKIRCNKCGWIGKTTANNLLRTNYGAECPKHRNFKRFNEADFIKRMNEKQNSQYKLLSKYVNFKVNVTVECIKCGIIFNSRPETLVTKRIGLDCKHHCKFNFEQAQKWLNKVSNTRLELIHFSGMHSIATFKCLKCGNTWKTTADNVFRLKSRCPICSSSRGEKAIIKYLKKKNIPFKQQFRLKECKDKKPLPFDFAVFNKDRSLNCLIEYQGCQHFIDPFSYSKKDFINKESVIRTQKHDAIKLSFCKEHRIKLIYINHPQHSFKTDQYNYIFCLVKRTLDKELKVS